jgi:nicotinamide-nucleotide amidase
MPDVVIVSSGSELMYGRVQDENACFLSERLFERGFTVKAHMAVGDDRDDIARAVTDSMQLAELVLFTGGLGPTDDDLTTETIAKLFGTGLEIHEPSRSRMETFFASMNRTTLHGDFKMVTVPGGSFVFPNEVGLAAGYALERDGITLIAMPGVPREMRHMFDEHVAAYLGMHFNLPHRDFLALRVVLMGEAAVNAAVLGMGRLLDNVEWGITTRPGMNTLTFLQKPGHDFPSEELADGLKRALGDNMLAISSQSIEDELVALLRLRTHTIACAESCTGGYIAKRITDIPGSSDVFIGGVVAYSNALKISMLGVPASLIEEHGAVSVEVAASMAEGARARTGAHIAISTTGIAGPGGGTRNKPVGMVCFGIAAPHATRTHTSVIAGDRERVRTLASIQALNFARTYCISL